MKKVGWFNDLAVILEATSRDAAKFNEAKELSLELLNLIECNFKNIKIEVQLLSLHITVLSLTEAALLLQQDKKKIMS